MTDATIEELTWPEANAILNELATTDDPVAVVARIGLHRDPVPTGGNLGSGMPDVPPGTIERWRERERELLSATYASADDAHRALLGLFGEIRDTLGFSMFLHSWMSALGLERYIAAHAVVELVGEAEMEREKLARVAPGVVITLRRTDGVRIPFRVVGVCETPWGPLARLESVDGPAAVEYQEAVLLADHLEALELRRIMAGDGRAPRPPRRGRGGRRASMPRRPC